MSNNNPLHIKERENSLSKKNDLSSAEESIIEIPKFANWNNIILVGLYSCFTTGLQAGSGGPAAGLLIFFLKYNMAYVGIVYLFSYQYIII
jgi:hypothetical protein